MNRQYPRLDQAYWPVDTSTPVLELTTGDVLRRAAQRYPERTALIEAVPVGMKSLTGADSTSRRWTYRELLGEAEQCAAWLLSRFSPGEHVCLWAPNVPEWMILQYGAALAGLVLVTANPALRSSELKYVIEQSRSAGLIYAAEFRGTDMAAIATGLRACVREAFCLSDWQTEVRRCHAEAKLPQVGPRDPAQIQYTSGTTGLPKGALLHHMGLVNNAILMAQRAGIDGAVLISPMPLFHTAGAVLSSLGCVTTGSTYILPLLFEPELIMAAVEREKCNVFFGVPTMQIALLEHPKREQYDLGSLRLTISGGAPVSPELIRRVESTFNMTLLPTYGQTEASPIITQAGPDDSIDDRIVTNGRPLAQVEVRIADRSTGRIQALNAEGEIQARGYQCMLGYFDMPDATAQAFTHDGWLRTGDLGTMDARGFVRVTGRLKDMIIRGGENVYPADIEARLLEHPGVMSVAVFGAPDSKWGEVVCAALRFRDGASQVSAHILKQHCSKTLAPHKVPSRWFSCEDFPMTASGKVQKFRLRERLQQGSLQGLDQESAR